MKIAPGHAATAAAAGASVAITTDLRFDQSARPQRRRHRLRVAPDDEYAIAFAQRQSTPERRVVLRRLGTEFLHAAEHEQPRLLRRRRGNETRQRITHRGRIGVVTIEVDQAARRFDPLPAHRRRPPLRQPLLQRRRRPPRAAGPP
jgi:hypothetical protein